MGASTCFRRASAFLLLLAFPAPAEPGDTVQLPVAVSATGFGGVRFRTRVAVLNLANVSNDVVAFVGQGGGSEVLLGTLAPGEQRVWEDFLPEAADRTGAAGVLLMGRSGAIAVAAEVIVAGEAGTYAVHVPVRERFPYEPEGVPVSFPVTVDARFRTNVACSSVGGGLRVLAEVFDTDGRLVESCVLKVGAGEWSQVALRNPVSGGRVAWTPMEPPEDDRWDCYAVTVDNGTGDARISVSRDATGGSFHTVPYVESGAKSEGEKTRSELALLNLTDQQFSVDVWAHQWSSPDASYELGPHAFRFFEDTLTTAGSLRSVLLESWSRYSFAPSVTLVTESGSRRRLTPVPRMFPYYYKATAVTPGVRNDEIARTLLRCSNLYGASMDVRADVHDEAGRLVEAHEFRKAAHGVAEAPVEASLPSGYVRWRLDGVDLFGDAHPHFCWAVVVLKGSGDETLFPAQSVEGF